MVDDYFRQYGLIMIYSGIAIVIPTSLIVVSWLSSFLGIRPKKPSHIKYSLYECGVTPIGEQRIRFNFRYYLFALLFVAFDVVVIFLYPWAVRFQTLPASALGVMAVFVGFLMVAWIYAWKKGALEWD
jgi:NADH-quinone oxidoreductase subunit A